MLSYFTQNNVVDVQSYPASHGYRSNLACAMFVLELMIHLKNHSSKRVMILIYSNK